MDEISMTGLNQETEGTLPVDSRRVGEFAMILEKYRTGKRNLERRIVESEKWWKLRNEQPEERESDSGSRPFYAKSGWLHNVIVSKHADAMDSYPEALILPREPGDQEQAKMLSAVLPVILEENHFEKTYADAWWTKLKTGTAVYQVKWDAAMHNGLGDIDISTADVLNLFWEPGVEDIQKSRYLFYAQLEDNENLEEEYPQLKGKLGGAPLSLLTRYVYDDYVSTEGKSLVVDVYYKRRENSRTVLHYCKYVGDTVLYATENETDGADGGFGGEEHRGLYDDGQYPFVFDVLWPVKGSPCGYGYVDLCRNPQELLDMMDSAFLKNFQANVLPRFFSREDGNVNEQEFLDLRRPLVHVAGNVDEASLRSIPSNYVSGNYVTMYQNKIQELRETSGNTESANGVYSSGVTAASAIAAMQEASGKTSRDAGRGGYRAFGILTEMVIERVRQFYTMPRTFRIRGELGKTDFTVFDNSGLVPQTLGGIGQEDLGLRLPVFDVRIETQKKNAYTRTSQNELILNFFDRGFFNPQYATQALACVQQMDFDGKEELMQTLQRNGTLYEQMQQLSQYVVALLQKYEPENAATMAQSLGAAVPLAGGGTTGSAPTPGNGENRQVEKARERANTVGTPEA